MNDHSYDDVSKGANRAKRNTLNESIFESKDNRNKT